jgi:hypothetical protein
LSEKVVWQLIRPYAEAAGVAGIAQYLENSLRGRIPFPASQLAFEELLRGVGTDCAGSRCG